MEFRPRKVPLSRAWAWPREAIELVLRRPLEPVALATLIGLSALLDIGSVGGLVALLLLAATPSLVGFVCVLACRADSSTAVAMSGGQWRRLVVFGLALVLATLFMNYAITSFSTSTTSVSTTREFSQSWQVSPIAAVLGGLSMSAMFWPWPLTIALVALDDLDLARAFTQTVEALLLNAASTIVLYLAFGVAFLLTLLSWPPLAGAMFVFMAFTSYTAYRDIWRRRSRNSPLRALSGTDLRRALS